MPGLDQGIIDDIDWNLALASVRTDTRSDFILAPHFSVIYRECGNELIERTCADLRNGKFEPRLPLTINVPKGPLLTRPGSILEPSDRLVYQALVENAVPHLEAQMNRNRAFSHIPSTNDGALFESSQSCWAQFQARVENISTHSEFVLRTDIANFFEAIPQHPLINMMEGTGVPNGTIRLLEELLSSFTGRVSAGIIQGVYPSDYLGNFFLSGFDGDCEIHGTPSARYVDDIYAGFPSELDAKRALVRISAHLRQNGLSLNDRKTAVLRSENLIHEEQTIDRLFNAAREEIQDEIGDIHNAGYGFQGNWIDETQEDVEEEDIRVAAVTRLLEYEDADYVQREKIDRFCIPILRAAHSEAAIEHVLGSIHIRPQLTKIYASYLSRYAPQSEDIRDRVEALIEHDNFVTDYERMYMLASVMNCRRMSISTVNIALRWLEGVAHEPQLRALAGIFAAKFGTGTHKRRVRLRYENEQSEYVRAALLYASRYFGAPERRAARRAWSGHSAINALVGQAITR